MPPKTPNPFIIIEAIDGAGKSTQTELLIKRLKKDGYQISQFHFPQEHKATGQLIYQKYLHSHNTLKFTRREQSLLYLQDFFSRLEDLTQSLNQKGKHAIISDRFYTSTLAYQTKGLSGASRQKMSQFIKHIALKGEPALPAPNLVIYLDIPPQIASHNLGKSKRDYHEQLSRLQAFRLSHLKTAQEEKWTTINCVDSDGTQRTVNDIHQEIWTRVLPILT